MRRNEVVVDRVLSVLSQDYTNSQHFMGMNHQVVIIPAEHAEDSKPNGIASVFVVSKESTMKIISKRSNYPFAC